MEVRGNVKVVFSDGTFELQERRLRINVKFECVAFPEQIYVQVFNLRFVGGAGNAVSGRAVMPTSTDTFFIGASAAVLSCMQPVNQIERESNANSKYFICDCLNRPRPERCGRCW